MKVETEPEAADTGAADQAVKIAQRCLESNPAIILGSGASIPHDLPSMEELARDLAAFVPGGRLGATDGKRWHEFKALLGRESNLETALHKCSLPRSLSEHVVRRVWEVVSDADLGLFESLASNNSQLPLSRLFRHLFGSSNPTLSVVTTNYDRLAEYAADQAGYYHDTGLTPGYLRLPQTGSRFWFVQKQGPTVSRVRTGNIWKVHGCLGWFQAESGEIMGMPPSRAMLGGCRPAIITPTREKYERALEEPFRSILAGADASLEKARAYLCIGFGFNDKHIQPKLESNWTRGKALLVILAKKLSPAAKKMLSKANGNDFLALEEADSGTRAWSHLHLEGMVLPDCSLWRLEDFLDQTT